MELALPHIVIRACGAGADLVAALSVHPVEVSEARDASEMHRISGCRPALLVIVVDPPDARAVVAETWADFPGVPILIVSDSAPPFVPSEIARSSWVDMVGSSQPLPDICWLVLEAVSRAAHVPGIVERPLGPHLIEVNDRGIVSATSLTPDIAIAGIRRLRLGDSLPALVDPLERSMIVQAIEQAHAGGARFFTVRLLDSRGQRHALSLGVRRAGEDRVAILAQPLISGGPIVGRHINNRDPITGLLTRWAMSRALKPTRRDEGRLTGVP